MDSLHSSSFDLSPPPMHMAHLDMANNFAAVQQPPPADQAHADNTDRARAYKSRNKRPCDFCRYKKAACHLDSQPPCELCIRYNKECTFVESPAKRRRPNENNNGEKNGMGDYRHERHSSLGDYRRERNSSLGDYRHERNSSMSSQHFGNGVGGLEMQQDFMPWENGMPYNLPPMDIAPSIPQPEFALDPAFYNDPSMAGFEAFEPMSATTTIMDQKLPNIHQHASSIDTDTSPQSSSGPPHLSLSLPVDVTSGEPSLDQQSSSNSTIVGLSGESDPYLLSRYRYDQYNEASFQSLRIRKMNDGPGPENSIPTFFTIQHNALASKAQPPERQETLDRYRREVDDMVGEDVGKRLITLFYKYVQPYFPILSREGGNFARDEDGVREPSSVPTSLLAAIYGHALPFCAWDEKLCVQVYTPPSADALFRIAWLAVLPSLHTPCLATLQTLLLLVQRRPTNKHVSDTPFKGAIMTTAVTIAHSLGLNRDPGAWPLPAWEIKQRRRLAWATFIQDKWLALNSGRPSHLHPDNWDVQPLTPNDFPDRDRALEIPDKPPSMSTLHFTKLADLTCIVDDILRDLFSLRATKNLHTSLEKTLEVAKPLRLRLTEWYQSLPPGLLPQPRPASPGDRRRRSLQHHLDGNGSLHLAYITAKIELFRAMLRPRVTDTNATAVSALRTGALTVAREALEFLEGLNARELEAFWASYARTNFTITSTFILLLFATAPSVQDARECLNVLNAWRALLRVKSRSCDLLNLALLRLDGVFVAGVGGLVELSQAAGEVWAESGGSS